MKLVIGLGNADDLPALVEAGADELFVGYVPETYLKKYGMKKPLNRREVRFYNVQIGSESELRIIKLMAEKTSVRITIAINALYYEEEQIQDVVELIRKCEKLGFCDYIIADWKLIEAISRDKELADINIHVSGELGELNHAVIQKFMDYPISRIIFPRQTSLEEMDSMIRQAREYERRTKAGRKLEFEAFVLNEKCHFTGAYCNSLHCDELCHMCRVPYVLANKRGVLEEEDDFEEQFAEALGESGCGMCNLYLLQKIGITHLKVVSRGNSGERTRLDILGLKEGLRILKQSKDEKEYVRLMKKQLFPDGCSGNCYGGVRHGMEG